MLRLRHLFVCALLLCAISAGCRKKQPVRAHGIVLDAVTREPLAGIDVVCEISGAGGERTSAVSGKDGHFVITGKIDIEQPFELKAQSKGTLTATISTPRLPFPGEVHMEVLSNDIPNGFSVPTAGGLKLGARVTARVALPPADRPTAPLRHSWKSGDVTDAVPKLKLGADGAARVVVAPPPEKCDCLIEPVSPEHPDGDAAMSGTDSTKGFRITTWIPTEMMQIALMQVLEVPKGSLAPGRYVFWPNTPPPYDAMANQPEVFRTGYLFEVE
jgi:hypothetical protein